MNKNWFYSFHNASLACFAMQEIFKYPSTSHTLHMLVSKYVLYRKNRLLLHRKCHQVELAGDDVLYKRCLIRSCCSSDNREASIKGVDKSAFHCSIIRLNDVAQLGILGLLLLLLFLFPLLPPVCLSSSNSTTLWASLAR